nr:uncharacterized protein LOC114820894 [Malus domestica]
MAHVEVKEAEKEYIWFLDSGCSNHMCGKREVFIEMDDSFRESVKLGYDSSLSVKGKGKVRLEVHGIMHVITGVFFVPELKNNLLSIVQLQERGLVVLMQHGKCKIFHPEKGLILETEMTCNRMSTEGTKMSHHDNHRSSNSLALKRVKLDDKSLKCILMGVSEESKAYRLFDPISQKIIISRDVVFEEDEQWNWDEVYEQAVLTDLEWETDEETTTENEEGSGDIENIEDDEFHEVGGAMTEGSASQERRTQRPPIWMRDYET